MKRDFFVGLGLDYILFVGHQLPDRDVACAEYIFCEAHGLSWKDSRIRLLFVPKGRNNEAEEYSQDGFFHTDLNKWIPFLDDNSEETEGVKKSRVLIIHFDTGRRYLPLTAEHFKEGIRVFYYDHHGSVDNGISATGLVFRDHEDRLVNHPYYEHFKVMAEFVNAKDYGRDYNGRDEYEMRNLYGVADLLRGLDYMQMTGERTKKDDAYWADAIIGAFYMLDAFMSVRLMFGRNFTEARKGKYENLYGCRLYSHDFRGSPVNGQTARIYFGKGPYINGKQQVDCIITCHRDRIQVVIYRDEFKTPEHVDTDEILRRVFLMNPNLRKRVEHDFNDELAVLEKFGLSVLLDLTSIPDWLKFATYLYGLIVLSGTIGELKNQAISSLDLEDWKNSIVAIKSWLQEKYGLALKRNGIYNDSRDFLIHFSPDDVSLDELVKIVRELIEERRDKFLSQMLDDTRALKEEIDKIASLSGSSAQAQAWRTFYNALSADKQVLAAKLFVKALSAHGDEEISSVILDK